MKSLSTVLLLFLFCSFCWSQDKSDEDEFRFDKYKPSAYITFEKTGLRESKDNTEYKEEVWLRFHNNSKWNLTIKTLGCRNIQEECSVFYEVRLLWNYSGKKSEIPIGKRMAHISSVKTVESKKSVLFSVPKSHLAEGLYIELEFNYDWEMGGNGGDGSSGISHKIAYYSFDLAKKLKLK